LKIYTKFGDQGETQLFGGKRVAKSDDRVEAYGDVDELNASLGVAIAILEIEHKDEISEKKSSPWQNRFQELLLVQHQLFRLGAELATDNQNIEKLQSSTKLIDHADAHNLEKQIDQLDGELPPLKNFVLPGGHKLAAQLHWSRCIARRAERSICKLELTAETRQRLIPFVNRLSDWLFVFSRWVNHQNQYPEKIWKSHGT
jgi:cob(I)alamin adenosyltransferase